MISIIDPWRVPAGISTGLRSIYLSDYIRNKDASMASASREVGVSQRNPIICSTRVGARPPAQRLLSSIQASPCP
ncbi:hypothetical protein [Sphingomonas psychrolutea]|uniref:hypothetical protein n=1 Tax=Sphingomonas psychrolutea TaxID=1259676 RepID=UPI00166D38F9|nr:hypothetical protein [Sphingomonas psychrolutea]